MARSDEIQRNIEFIQERIRILREETNIINNIADLERRRNAEIQIATNNRILQAEKLKLIEESNKTNTKLTREQRDLIDEIDRSETNINKDLKQQQNLRKNISNIISQTGKQLQKGWEYLMASDKAIKSTALNLGLSGAKAEMLRGSFEQSAQYVARLGGNLEDIQTITEGFANETGRARALTSQMIQDITAIGKGTGLGIEGATQMAAQFELMGVDVRQTMNYAQGIVDTSERMGVNTTKVFKNINDNFKRLNQYNFQQGVKGYAQMAAYAEKMQISMNEALNAADTARSLEGAVNLAAQLQVMGGEFAKTDPFELLFLSRNDPAKFTEKINDMTKGVVTFRKMADGTFEKFISPADRDRLAAVEKSLGMQSGELTKQAERMADIQKMRNQMRGLGLSKEQKELVEGAAVFNSDSGKFQVQIAGSMRDLSSLTKDQAKSFASEQKSLEARAKEAQTFDEVFKATINELKSTLLPLLRGVNSFLTTVRGFVEPVLDWIGKFTKGLPEWSKGAGMLLAGGMLLKGIIPSLMGVGKFLVSGISGVFGKLGSVVKGGKAAKTGSAIMKTGGAATKGGGGLSALGKGAGMGVALAGAGAGIMMAAEGLSKLADSMSKLDDNQAKTLESIINSLLIFTGFIGVLAIGVVAFGSAATTAALGLLAFGAAVALIGGGVYLAATGIGNMSEGLAKLVESGKGASDDMLKLSAGIGALSLAMLGFTTGAVGLLVFSGVMNTIAKHADAITRVGEGFKQINAVMSGNKEDYIAVANAIERISNANISSGGMFSELATLLKTPLKVEFADKDVSINTDVTLNLDGQKFMNKTYSVNTAIQKYEALRQGKGNNA